MFGSLLLTLGVLVAVIGLLDLGMYMTGGISCTLSEYIANSVPHSAAAFLATNGLSFTAGMLATHFTAFRMEPSKGMDNDSATGM